jgi:hypothetical protein
MPLYELKPSDQYNGLQPATGWWRNEWFMDRCDGRRLASEWTPFAVRSQRGHDGVRSHNRDGDYPSLRSSIPVMNERALAVLHPLIAEVVEVLPLAHVKGLKLCITNILDVIDCLDTERSEGHRFEGTLLSVDRFVFKPGTVDGHHFFKVKGFEGFAPFVSQQFKDLVDLHELQGFRFRELMPDGTLQLVPEHLPRPTRAAGRRRAH